MLVKFELYEKEGQKRAIFEDGTDWCIHKTSEGKEFVHLPNFNDKTVFKCWGGKLKDAVESIRNGYGDVLQCGSIFGGSSYGNESVVYFLDREYGEEKRAEFIEGWKNTQFCFTVTMGFSSSMHGPSLLTEKYDRVGIFGTTDKILTFNTEEEAESFIQRMTEVSEKIAKEYLSLDNEGQSAKLDSLDSMEEGQIILNMMGNYIPEESENGKWRLNVIQFIH